MCCNVHRRDPATMKMTERLIARANPVTETEADYRSVTTLAGISVSQYKQDASVGSDLKSGHGGTR